MLVLTRTQGSGITIGGKVVVHVLNVDKNTGQVKLGIEAPKEVVIVRNELLKGIADEKAVTDGT